MTPEQRQVLADGITLVYNIAKKIMEDLGRHTPMLFILKNGSAEGVDFSAYIDDKTLMAMMIKAMQQQPDVDGTILLTEAWTLAVDSSDPRFELMQTGKIKPSEESDRVETLFFLAETRVGDLAAQAVIRHAGTKTFVEPLQIMTPDGFSGRFVGGTFRHP